MLDLFKILFACVLGGWGGVPIDVHLRDESGLEHSAFWTKGGGGEICGKTVKHEFHNLLEPSEPEHICIKYLLWAVEPGRVSGELQTSLFENILHHTSLEEISFAL